MNPDVIKVAIFLLGFLLGVCSATAVVNYTYVGIIKNLKEQISILMGGDESDK